MSHSHRRLCCTSATGRLSGLALLLGFVAAAACDGVPRDPEGTLERVRAHRTIRVGLIAAADSPMRRDEDRLVALLEARSGSRAHRTIDSCERLLTRLERGALDAVVGELSTDSPWATRVTILSPLRKSGEDEALASTVAVRNGENAWLALVARAIDEQRAAQ